MHTLHTFSLSVFQIASCTSHVAVPTQCHIHCMHIQNAQLQNLSQTKNDIHSWNPNPHLKKIFLKPKKGGVKNWLKLVRSVCKRVISYPKSHFNNAFFLG